MRSREPLASVTGLILHFRTPVKTLNCLSSLSSEGIKSLVIIDNSEDGGKSIASMQDELEQLRKKDIHIVVLSRGYNLGFAAGVNDGMNYILNHINTHVLLINSDAELESGALKYMLSSLEADSIVIPLIAQSSTHYASSFSFYDALLSTITNRPWLVPISYVSGCCILFHYSILSARLFDESFFFYGEDVMLSFTLKEKRIHAIQCEEAKVLHATSSSAKNGSFFYEYHINRAHWLLAKKLSTNWYTYLIFLLVRSFTLSLRATTRCIRNRNLTAWKGLLMASLDILMKRKRSFTPPNN